LRVLVVIGRSSSHFTRVTRIFAAELSVDYGFQPVRDLMSTDVDDWAGNPALRLPTLRTPDTTWFGALPICRELARRSALQPRIVWPEQLDYALTANAQELIVQAMSTEVSLIMGKAGAGEGEGNAHHDKLRASLTNTLAWLEEHAERVLAQLPRDRDLSYLEVTLFCLVTHLEFRHVVPTAGYVALRRFCDEFGQRPATLATAYRFDV
jgi:glutathione S-transferase